MSYEQSGRNKGFLLFGFVDIINFEKILKKSQKKFG